ncbi:MULTISPECIES: hypothetical protein [unclassified Halomonas]|uniref:hypothetical protein n=1 Tax=unclassified Halomonas TaxID=2609666 RepID=UPI0006DB3DF9|nr:MULTISPECIES: hypothetical protein [unclassified Halomonas]KPQ20480.1 MAG: hypothetical protein HLUCCO06_03495 [Halomonas sp. HL-93]SBR46268.1 hypothetical protein GA0071314_0638 [Halomonas sp. HL-93]SNY98665.1 hypothetical protein SAMN04488142_3291 [Halomonas sp. hl-4]
MKLTPISFICMLALGGCQAIPSSLPSAEPPPAESCYFPIEDPSTLTASVDVLTEWGFSLDASDTQLGLLSASREKELYGYSELYASPHYRSRSSMSVFGGVGGGGGTRLGVGLSGGFGQSPTEIERVSLLWDREHMRVSRDIRRFDQYGSLREGRSASTEAFCQRLQHALDAHAATGERSP